MKKIIGRFWSIVFLILFSSYYVLLFPLYFVLLLKYNKHLHNIAHYLNVGWSYFSTLPEFIFVRVSGKKHLKNYSNVIFTPNHSSYMDIPVCYMALPRQIRFMAKYELAKIPLFGYMYGRLQVTVDRSNPRDGVKALQEAKRRMNDGASLVIFPEGTISETDELLPFKTGAFRLAIKNKAPIVPVTIVDLKKIALDDGRWMLFSGVCRVIISEPIETKELTMNDLEAVKDRTQKIIEQNLLKYGRS